MTKILLLTAVIFFFTVSMGFSFYTTDTGFPYKALVYRVIGVTEEEQPAVKVSVETANHLNFIYNGKGYQAQLFRFGAIYLIREGQNPLWIPFDVTKYRNIIHGV